ncbi:MAG: LysR substrate-binding domain-containing protein [Acinetobacter sp.]
MDKIERLKIFCLVAEKQSFAQVASQLDLPRSSITYAVKSLEKEYEVLLLNRTTRKVNLTNEGVLFYQEVRQLIIQSEALNKFKLHNREHVGQIKIGLPLRMATQYLIPHLDEFYQKYPKVRVLIHSSDDFSNLIEERLDCVVRVGNVNEGNLIARPIVQVDLYTVASESYLHHYDHAIDAMQNDHVQNHFMIAYQLKNSDSGLSHLFFKDRQIELPYQLLVEDTESYLQAGLQGLGIFQIPAFDAIPFIQNRKLIRLFEKEACLKLDINFLFLERKYRPIYFQYFIIWLESLLKSKLSTSL